MSAFQHVEANQTGRDFAVGDIHGHFARLQQDLDRMGFDPARDRLFCVGDLVDRGPLSPMALDWLDKPWLFAVQGNHEALAIDHVQGTLPDYEAYLASGGAWFLELPAEQQQRFAARFSQMPIALELDTADGLIGFVHADCPFSSWDLLRSVLLGQFPGLAQVQQRCQWSRERLRLKDTEGISDLRALVVGHTPVPRAEVLGNVFHIDTGGWKADGSGYFTFLELDTLRLNASRADLHAG
ncbi:metallophosphoesterase (plasmid) [Pseudomonas sp. R1-18]|uniref:metallophosphoesterase n=1 Tax=Pseudomonas sp. R1-18 TaxID=1632772 RepID=UPI003DA93343